MNRMKSRFFITLLFLFSNVSFSQVSSKAIYGDDDRLDVFETSNSLHRELSLSTAAMVANWSFQEVNSEEYRLLSSTLEESGKCSSERFAKQPIAANCSGFLVGKNKLVTAGHCVPDQANCNSFSWVFDYKVDYADQSEVIVEKNKVFKCKRVIKASINEADGGDYALIELAENVEGRKALEFRTSGRPQIGDELVVIGHPSGLPTKISAGAQVKRIGATYLHSNLDTYGGNSGSAVFNSRTGVVEGILVHGQSDYVFDESKGCLVSTVFSDTTGEEGVTLITNIKELNGIDASSDNQSNDDVVVDNHSDDDISSDDDVLTDDIASDDNNAVQAPRRNIFRRVYRWFRRLFR